MKKALTVVDYQNDFVSGALGFDGAEALDEKIVKRIEECREQSYDIIFTFDTHDENYLETEEGRKLPVEHCIEGTWGWQAFGKVRENILPGDKCFFKETFGSLELGDYLQEAEYEEVELCGLVSNICVFANAAIAKAACPNAKIKVNRSLTSSADAKTEEKAMEILENLHVDVIK